MTYRIHHFGESESTYAVYKLKDPQARDEIHNRLFLTLYLLTKEQAQEVATSLERLEVYGQKEGRDPRSIPAGADFASVERAIERIHEAGADADGADDEP